MTTRRTETGFAPLWLVPVGLLAMPFVEFAAFFWVAGRIGLFAALLALLATSFLGASLLRSLGGSALSRLMSAFRRGEPPEGAARESFLVALGGVLMILPGFVTDLIGFALIAPALLRRLREGSSVSIHRAERRTRPRADPRAKVIDLSEGEWQQIQDRPKG